MPKVLIVDDEELQRQALRQIIVECHLPDTDVIAEASNGRRALEVASASEPDIVLMDIEMPEMDGLKTIAALKDKYPNIKTIVITAYDYFEYAQQALKLGANDFLLKPVRTETLRTELVNMSREIENEKAKQDAMMAPSHVSLTGKNLTDHVDDVQDSGSTMSPYPFEKEEQLVSLVRLGDRANAQGVLVEILQEIRSAGHDYLDLAKMRVHELLTIISRSAAEGGADGGEIFKAKLRHLDQVASAKTTRELQDAAMHAVDAFVDLVIERKELSKLQLMKDAMAFIQANYQRGLTLGEVARVVDLSPGYFSRLFKKWRGITWTEYVAQLRMEKAMRLLRNSGQSIGEISSALGYGDPNYFSRAFSKATGMSPSKFRQVGKS